MEGNGPIQGEPRLLGRIILADDPVAADATCSRLTGLDPKLIRHINQGGGFLGNLDEDRIDMLGERRPRKHFSVSSTARISKPSNQDARAVGFPDV